MTRVRFITHTLPPEGVFAGHAWHCWQQTAVGSGPWLGYIDTNHQLAVRAALTVFGAKVAPSHLRRGPLTAAEVEAWQPFAADITASDTAYTALTKLASVWGPMNPDE